MFALTYFFSSAISFLLFHASALKIYGFTYYLRSMDFQRELQSKHHLYCEQEKPAHCHGSLLLRLGTHQIQNRTRDAHKISPHGTMTKRTPAMNCDHAVSWERLFAVHGLSERTTVQTSSLLLRFLFFSPLLGQPDPTRPISLTLTQTPTPADRVVPIHSWRPLGHSTVWADFVCVSGSVLYLVRTQFKK